MIDEVAKPRMCDEEIENGMNNIKDGMNALDGEDKLEEGKENGKLLINSLKDLNAGERDGINRLVNEGETREKVGEEVESGEALNEGMK
ncbi:hypothetical protein, partial [Staphylococcus epidermidis]|uniref:hypothetical protein n=1 Tax=Staphylococcus epidermidis TaxID=1282 RepID=UPI0021B35938